MQKVFLALILALNVAISISTPCQADPARTQFSQFSALLPPGWEGEEQTGFISNNPAEYQLTMGKKDESGDSFLAQLSIYLLPNKPGADSEKAARALAEAQADSSEPVLENGFWTFRGEPRTRAMSGAALTMVKTTPELMLIIIAQDPEALGSDQIIASLRGETAAARSMLGR